MPAALLSAILLGTMSRKVYVVGVGMTQFCKPGTGDDYPEMAAEAGAKGKGRARSMRLVP